MENRENKLKITQSLVGRKLFKIARLWVDFLRKEYGEEETKEFFKLINV